MLGGGDNNVLNYLKIFLPILIGQIGVNFTNVYLTSAPDLSTFLTHNLRFGLLIIIANGMTILGWFWAYQSNINLFFIFVITLSTAILTQSLGAVIFVAQMPTLKQLGALILLIIAGILAH